MNPTTCRTRAILLAGCLSAAATSAQVTFEESEFAGWSTFVSGFTDRTVSGAAQGAGGNPDAHYLVRHAHEHFESFPSSVVSASLSPIALDPAEIGLADTPRFSVDLRFEVDHGGPELLAPTLYWTPVLRQGETLYRYANPGNVTFSEQNAFVRVAADLAPGAWSMPSGRPPLDLSAPAPPVRLGLLLQSDVVVTPGQQAQVRIRIDNLRLGTLGEDDLPRVSLVAVPSPAGGHVVFAPPECFDGSPGTHAVTVLAESDRPWDGCVDVRAPNLAGDPVFGLLFCFSDQVDPTFALETYRYFGCQAGAPPHLVELLPPDDPGGLRALLGSPSLARVEPCLVRVAGGDLSCRELQQGVCPFEALFGLLCEVDLPCYDGAAIYSITDSIDSAPRASAGRAVASAGDAIDTLRRVRDEVMGATPAGRYYRDLYEAFSPELRDLLLADLRIVRDLLAAAPPWLAALDELVNGGGGEATITAGMIADVLAIFDRFESKATPALREVFRRERARLRLEDFAGRSIEDAFALVEERGGPPACASTDTALCLQGGRFRVEVTWTDFDGGSGAGHAVPLSSDSGYFWFFNPENIELGLKVLDGRAINGRFWVFYGALSNVEYTVLVTDSATGAVRAYRNPSRVFASVGDTSAFTPDGAPRDAIEPWEDQGESTLLARLTTAASDTVRQRWRRLRDVFVSEPSSAPTALARPGRPLTPGSGLSRTASVQPRATCVAGGNALCLAGNRFRVEVEWRDFEGGSGFGTAAPLTADTGSFWFFYPGNTELIVKVLDARAVNGHFWVFYGAMSNVEYTLRVTDTATGAVRTYHNPSGTFASRGDVEAF